MLGDHDWQTGCFKFYEEENEIFETFIGSNICFFVGSMRLSH